MNFRITISFVIITLSFLVSSCSNETKKQMNIQPAAFGVTNGIVLIADEDVWKGPIGDSIRFYFSAPYLILPQPEPVFDIKHFTPDGLLKEPIRREFRHIIFVGNIKDDHSPTTRMIRKDIGVARVDRAYKDASFNSLEGKNKWARNQSVIYLFGKTDQDVANSVIEHYPAIAKKFQNRDRDLIKADTYTTGLNTKVMEEVKAAMDVDIKIPAEYFMAVNDGETIWIRKENSRISSNLLMTRIPYKDKAQFSKKNIKAIRDKIGKKYVSTRADSTYMQTNDIDLPMFTTTTTLNNDYCMEARGIWEVVNDFMGGPFIGYLVHNPDKKELLYIEGFLHAPSQNKRNYMQQLELIIGTAEY